MRDEDKTREQLLEELRTLRAPLARPGERGPPAERAPHASEEAGTKALPAERDRLQIQRLPLAYILMDADGRVLDWNPAAEKLFGYTQEEALGRACLDLIVPLPLDDHLQEILRRVWAGDMDAHSVNENRTRDGRLITCEWFNTPLRNSEGRVTGVISLAQDVSERRRAEEKLRWSEALLAEAERLAHVGSWSWDVTSDTVLWSEEHYHIFGLQPNETGMTYHRVLSRIHPDDRATLRNVIDQSLRERQPFECRLRALHDDGTVRLVQSRGRVVFDEGGKPVRIFGTVQDITDQTLAREALEASRRRFQTVFQNSLDLNSTGEAIYDMDLDGRCTFCNRACLRLLGYAAARDLLGKDMHALIHHTRADGTPYPLEECRIYRGFRQGEGIHVKDEVLWRADGTSFPAEYWSYPVYQGTQLVGTVVTFVDVSERRQVEEELRTLNAALENAVEGIARLDTQGRYVTVNPAYAAMVGYRPEELVGGNWPLTVHPDDRDKIEAAYRRMLSEGRVEAEVMGMRKDHSAFWKQVVMVKATDRQGRWGGHYCFMKDITERKTAEGGLERYAGRLQALSRRLVEVQEEERRHLARELHDEIGQVLAAINFQLHAAKGLAGAAALARLEECARLVQQAGEQVRGLALELRPAMLDVLGLEAALHWLAERHQQRTGCEVRVEGHLPGEPLPPDLAIACFRAAQEALTNVVRHAQARHVWIKMGEAEGALELAIRDDGVGFDVGAAQRRAAELGSLGLLGMAERVQLLGGRLHVESQPGRGTRIRASFPLSAGADNSAGPAE